MAERHDFEVLGSDGVWRLKADPMARFCEAAPHTASIVHNSQYVWGAAGTNSFDCSGLMLWSFKHIGISLPHSAIAQSQLGKAVSVKDLEPGDLLFFCSPVHHVGMYIGDGRFVHARSPRNGLQVNSLEAYGHFTSARRIIGA